MKGYLGSIFLLFMMLISCKEDLYKFPVQIMTQEAKKIKATSAQIQGLFINPGNESFIEKGFYYAPNDSAGQILKNKITVVDTGFSTQLKQLQANTSYSYFAFAKMTANDLHGPVKSFKTLEFQTPTVSTTDIKNILITTCLAGGEVTYDGGKIVIDRGVCLSLTRNPTLKDIRIQIGRDEGVFSSVISKLLPFTTYYLRAYATNDLGTSYGKEIEFKTQDYRLATLSTSEPESIQIFEVTLGGETTDEGGGTISQKGVCLSKNPNPTIDDMRFVSSSLGLGRFKIVITELSENTKYYVRAFAKNEKGYAYGEEKSFKTQDIRLPLVETTKVSEETFSSALLEGKLIDDGGVPILEQGFCYSLQPTPDVKDQIAMSPNFRSLLQNLQDGTTYYVRAFAKNKKGIGYGETKTFKTAGYTYAEVFTHDITTFSTNSAEINGLIINEGNTPVTERGICLSTSQNPTIDNTKGVAGKGSGAFGYVFQNLKEGQVYYARAYGANLKGVSYGAEKSVRIKFTPAVVVGSPPSSGGGSSPPSSGGSGGGPSDPPTFTCPSVFASNVPSSIKIGDNLQGGKVAYIFRPGEFGYVPGQVHGIIASYARLPQISASWGFRGTGVLVGTSTALGTGCENTLKIITAITNFAANGRSEVKLSSAQACLDYSSEGYEDWFLPSLDELKKLKEVSNLIGDESGGEFGSSSETDATTCKTLALDRSITDPKSNREDIPKNSTILVRPIHYF